MRNVHHEMIQRVSRVGRFLTRYAWKEKIFFVGHFENYELNGNECISSKYSNNRVSARFLDTTSDISTGLADIQRFFHGMHYLEEYIMSLMH